jgi:hypothetical protein
MKKLSQLLAFPLIILTVLLSVACSKRGDEKNSPAVIARNAEFDQKLNSLTVDTDIAHFHQLLGQPASQKQREITSINRVIKRHARPRSVEEKFTYIEYLYPNDHFYVQVVTDEAGKVGMYSITAIDADYSPTIQTVVGKPLQLGKTVYADFSPAARKIAADFSGNAAKPNYYEVVVGSGADPQYVVVSTNPVGQIGKMGKLTNKDGGTLIKWFSLNGHDFPLDEEHGIFRQNTTINTYTEVAPWFRGVDNSGDGANFGDAALNFGPPASP